MQWEGIQLELLTAEHGRLLWVHDGDSTPAPTPRADPASEGELLPAPSEGLELDPESESMLHDALLRVAELSGVRLPVDHRAHAVLARPSQRLTAPLSVAPEDAWGLVESMLCAERLVLVLHNGAEPRLASVHLPPPCSDPQFRELAWRVGPESLDQVKAHPALLFQLTLPVEAVDPLMTVNSLRGLMSEAYVDSFLPAEEARAVCIGGRGRNVYLVARAVQLADSEKLDEER